MAGKVFVLIGSILLILSCANLQEPSTGAVREQTGSARPVLKTYPDFDAYGVAIVSAPDGVVTGPIAISLQTREKLDTFASVVNAQTGKPEGAFAECTAVGSGWSIGAGFSESGAYKLSVYGKLQSSANNEYAPLFDLTFAVKVEASNWTFSPSFTALGFSVVSSPGSTVSGDARVVIAGGRPDVELACGLISRTTGKPVSQGVSMTRENGNTVIACIFPEDGEYALDLFAHVKGEKTGSLGAQAVFTVSLKESPDAALVRAMKLGDLDLVEKALDKGADPNTPMPAYLEWVSDGKKTSVDGYPAFQVLQWNSAGTDAKIKALRLLKSKGADFSRVTSEGSTFLDAFFSSLPKSGDEAVKMCAALLELGADPRQDTSYSYFMNGVPTHAKIGTLLALENYGHKDAVRRAALIPLLVKHGANLTARWPTDGATGLSHLISDWSAGAKVYIQAYLDAGANPGPDDLRQLAWLVRSSGFDGDWNFLSRIISKSSHVNDRDGYGSTLVHNMVDDRDLPRDLLTRVFTAMASASPDLNASTKYGQTPLMVAVEKGNMAAVDELLARGADPKRAGAFGENVFHTIASRPYAAAGGGAPVPGETAGTAALIDKFLSLGVDINARDVEGRTPIFTVCENGSNLELLKLFVAKGADPAASDLDGFTALGYAKTKAFKAITAYLASLKVPVASGGWPVGNAAPACKAVLDEDFPRIASLPVSDFQAKTARTPDGVPATPLHLAAESGSVKLIESLSARKVDWNVGDRYGRTPLEKAVLAGREDAVKALLKAGADPDRADDSAETPVTRAIASGSALTRALLAAANPGDWDGVCISMAVSSPLDLVKSFPRAKWGTPSLNACAVLGRTDILGYLGSSVHHETLTAGQLLERAIDSKKTFDEYTARAGTPLTAPRVEGAGKKGTYTLILKSWSPWMDVDPALNLTKYPVVVSVPKGYDGSEPYGLIISMMNAQSSNQAPGAAYIPTLEKHKLIWVGFDPYNRVFENGSANLQWTNHERLCLAAAYSMFRAYRIDRARVYLTGFSWGGRLTGEIVPKQPGIFTGGIAVGGCFTTRTGGRIIPSYPYARAHAAMVLATGDWDYNRQETYNGYNTFLTLGYEAYYFQEPKKGHARISGENFEKAVSLLDAAARRR